MSGGWADCNLLADMANRGNRRFGELLEKGIIIYWQSYEASTGAETWVGREEFPVMGRQWRKDITNGIVYEWNSVRQKWDFVTRGAVVAPCRMPETMPDSLAHNAALK